VAVVEAVAAAAAGAGSPSGTNLSTPEDAVEVPYTELSADTLRNLIEDFVTRDGTDYGLVEKTLDQKVAALRRQLESGHAKIFFERHSETINIVVAEGA